MPLSVCRFPRRTLTSCKSADLGNQGKSQSFNAEQPMPRRLLGICEVRRPSIREPWILKTPRNSFKSQTPFVCHPCAEQGRMPRLGFRATCSLTPHFRDAIRQELYLVGAGELQDAPHSALCPSSLAMMLPPLRSFWEVEVWSAPSWDKWLSSRRLRICLSRQTPRMSPRMSAFGSKLLTPLGARKKRNLPETLRY